MIDLASISAHLNKGLFKLGRRIGLFRGLNHVCEVKVYDKRGRLKAYRFIRQKLMLDNFKELLAGTFDVEEAVGAALYSRRVDVVDLGGVARTPATVAHVDIGTLNNRGVTFNAQASYTTAQPGTGVYGVRIRVGTGTVAPTRADYALASEVASGVPTKTVGADYITWSVAITLETAADIAEAGMSCRYQLGINAPPDYASFMLFRDVFTPIPVGVGETISITEKLTL